VVDAVHLHPRNCLNKIFYGSHFLLNTFSRIDSLEGNMRGADKSLAL
jgi:hypothetical protein